MNGGFSVGYFRQDGTPTTSADPAGMACTVDARGHRVTGWTSEGPSTDDRRAVAERACDACGQIGEHSSLCSLESLEAEVEQLRKRVADLPANDGTGYVTGSAYARLQAHHDAEVERLRAEIEAGWLALGFRRNPQHDVTIADGISRIRAAHAERLDADA